ncbi:hypothetical protein [Nocardioides panaciterrulae]|uniref:Uncharacterized protein n=1 Tax=Nocardioides panaciterrulae TaxID=661492 RepID=A0A7Y9EA67_9ACTN|nr:hypothetical protein [Nocardioides panaciterrulae]NYD43937.1 hypothetical protein [Nocardioides panaciterrulae]NYD44006.1 hypothetical protein [Nocardioides panaciterrulae]
MKVRIKVAQTGLYNGAPWPAVGKTIDLPDHVAKGMISAGHVEQASGGSKDAPKVETRPAPGGNVETREKTAKKATPAKKG